MSELTREFECPMCGDWIEVDYARVKERIICPECREALRLDVDVDNYGTEIQRDLSRLVTFGSHWDDKV